MSYTEFVPTHDVYVPLQDYTSSIQTPSYTPLERLSGTGPKRLSFLANRRLEEDFEADADERGFYTEDELEWSNTGDYVNRLEVGDSIYLPDAQLIQNTNGSDCGCTDPGCTCNGGGTHAEDGNLWQRIPDWVKWVLLAVVVIAIIKLL